MIKLSEIHLAERIHWVVEWRRKFLQVSLRTEQPNPEKCIHFMSKASVTSFSCCHW